MNTTKDILMSIILTQRNKTEIYDFIFNGNPHFLHIPNINNFNGRNLYDAAYKWYVILDAEWDGDLDIDQQNSAGSDPDKFLALLNESDCKSIMANL